MARLQKRKQAAVTTGSDKTSRPSLRGWFYGLYVISSETGLIAPVARKMRQHPRA
jgi:hypothetical protein